MVAYSFKAPFAEPIQYGLKRQTIRGERRRHARPVEPMQLYTGMRTRHCRRILDPDPICEAVRHIALRVVAPATIAEIAIDGMPVEPTDAWAAADGMEGLISRWPRDWGPIPDDLLHARERPTNRWIVGACAPLAVMGMFWRHEHGLGEFDGALLTWVEPHAGAYPDWRVRWALAPWQQRLQSCVSDHQGVLT